MSYVAQLRKLPIGRRTVLDGEGTPRVDRAVFCPLRESSVPTATCERCTRLRAIHYSRRGFVECEPPTPEIPATMDLPEAAARVAVGEIMRRDFVAVTADAAFETLITLVLEAGASCVPVVDGRRRVIGLVTKADLLRIRPESGISEQNAARPFGRGFHIETTSGTAASEVMTPAVHVLPESARVSHAIGLLACEHIGHLPVIDAFGALVGVLDRSGIVDWMAHQIGYCFDELSVSGTKDGS